MNGEEEYQEYHNGDALTYVNSPILVIVQEV